MKENFHSLPQLSFFLLPSLSHNKSLSLFRVTTECLKQTTCCMSKKGDTCQCLLHKTWGSLMVQCGYLYKSSNCAGGKLRRANFSNVWNNVDRNISVLPSSCEKKKKKKADHYINLHFSWKWSTQKFTTQEGLIFWTNKKIYHTNWEVN